MDIGDVLAVHSLDHFELAVPDLEKAVHFYTAFGLNASKGLDSVWVSTYRVKHPVLKLVEGQRKRLHSLTFAVYEQDFQCFEAHLKNLNLPYQTIATATGVMLRMHDPDGTSIEVIIAAKSSPSTPGNPRAQPRHMAPKRSQAPLVQPNRFSHVLLFTKDVDASLRFYSEVLGLRLSDRGGENIAFMHTPHGSDHHLVAFVKSEGPGLHHSSWNVETFDDPGLGARQLAASGYTDGWGVGRHVLGSNYFYYAKDPWDGYVEYSYDMDFVLAGQEWVAATHDDEDAFFIWGPNPPESFAKNSELI